MAPRSRPEPDQCSTCRAFRETEGPDRDHGWCVTRRRFLHRAAGGPTCDTFDRAAPPIFCDRGTVINQNLPASLGVGCHADHTLPIGTLEVWQNGRRIGRIVGIGIPGETT